ncbi:MAG: hypothetical protein MI923_30190 [Phycisphaerales bacterium]|nr:hypothetical protein [Phycisphaerales bacterium]
MHRAYIGCTWQSVNGPRRELKPRAAASRQPRFFPCACLFSIFAAITSTQAAWAGIGGGALPPILTEIDVTTVYTCSEERTFYIDGSNFLDGATVRLTKAGESDLIGGEILVITRAHDNAKQVRCQFFFPPGTAAGFWSVVVTNPDTQSDTLPDALEVIDDCPRGAVGDLYVCNTREDNILQYNVTNGELVCIFTDDLPPDTNIFDYQPVDLAWAPNGHLWVVTAAEFAVGPDAVVEYNGQTGEYIRYIVPPDSPEFSDPTFVLQTLSTGGPNGLLCLTQVRAENNSVHGLNPVTLSLEVAISAEDMPPMRSPRVGRFASNGKYLLLGAAQVSAIPTFREYDPEEIPFQFLSNNIIESGARKVGVIETLNGAGYLLSDIDGERNRVERYDIATGNISIVIPRSTCPESYVQSTCTADPCYWEGFLNSPNDLAYGPNGNLFICSFSAPVAADADWRDLANQCRFGMGAVLEFDPNTYEQIRVIGKAGTQIFKFGVGGPDHLYNPTALEFKPLPGDWGSSGSAFQGNWQIDEDDLDRFAVALADNRLTLGNTAPLFLAANLQSFDMDLNNEVSCGDWPAFAVAFETSRGYVPELPLPELPLFVDELLGNNIAPCLSDCNNDGIVDGRDIEPYLQALLN